MTAPIIRLPTPHSHKQMLIMNALITRDLREMWVACGTKFGKSLGGSAALDAKLAISTDAMLRWVAPIYSQAKIGFKYCKRMLPPEPHAIANRGELTLSMPSLDSMIEFKSGKFPEDLEGEAVDAYVLDEAAKLHEQVYDSAKTTTTVTRGPILGMSTPRGKNHFWKKCMQAKDEMEWALKNGRIPEKIYIHAPSTDNPFVSAAAVEEARRNMPDRLFRQYFMAEFIDDAAVFSGFMECLYGPDMEFDGAKQYWIDYESAAEAEVVIGADWAKTKDWTVFTAFDIRTRKLIGFQRFHKTAYTEAIRKLVLFARKFKDIIVLRHDKTGLGNVIDDQLAYTELPYEGVTFTNANKAEMVAQLITSVEQKMVGLPRWQHMIDEFESYEVITSKIGTMSYGAISGQHDDIISSLLLSHSALVQYSDDGVDISYMDDFTKPANGSDNSKDQLEKKLTPVEEFYRNLLEDDD